MFTLRWIWWAQPAMSSSGGGESRTVVSNNYIGTGPQCLAKLFCCEALHPVHTKDTIVFFAPFLFVVAYLSFWLLPVSSDDNFRDRWAKWDNQSHPPQLLSQSLLKKEKLVGHWLIFSQNLIFSFAFLDEQMCILVFTWWWFSNLIRQRKLMSTPLHRLIHPGVNWIKQTIWPVVTMVMLRKEICQRKLLTFHFGKTSPEKGFPFIVNQCPSPN